MARSWKVKQISNGYLVSSRSNRNSTPIEIYYEDLNKCIKYLQSFTTHEKGGLKQPTLRFGDSETPRHPYDRGERYWTEADLQQELNLKLGGNKDDN